MLMMKVSPVGLSKKLFSKNGIKMLFLHKILVMLLLTYLRDELSILYIILYISIGLGQGEHFTLLQFNDQP